MEKNELILEKVEEVLGQMEDMVSMLCGEKSYLYIDGEQKRVWISKLEASAILEKMEEYLAMEPIGKSPYAILFDERYKAVIDGEAYLFGNLLIIQKDREEGILHQKEEEIILQELRKRMKSVVVGGCYMTGYPLS